MTPTPIPTLHNRLTAPAALCAALDAYRAWQRRPVEVTP